MKAIGRVSTERNPRTVTGATKSEVTILNGIARSGAWDVKAIR
jgi:hypothetical protein